MMRGEEEEKIKEVKGWLKDLFSLAQKLYFSYFKAAKNRERHFDTNFDIYLSTWMSHALAAIKKKKRFLYFLIHVSSRFDISLPTEWCIYIS